MLRRDIRFNHSYYPPTLAIHESNIRCRITEINSQHPNTVPNSIGLPPVNISGFYNEKALIATMRSTRRSGERPLDRSMILCSIRLADGDPWSIPKMA
jgi:hypothetical protein